MSKWNSAEISYKGQKYTTINEYQQGMLVAYPLSSRRSRHTFWYDVAPQQRFANVPPLLPAFLQSLTL